ncbi:MAG: GAF domain-containing sensor histidine kinase [Armatimonadota bacterium]|nr:MAG: GAF domain-containing sensor histidine kinase [Armatimonadota bacterium]
MTNHIDAEVEDLRRAVSELERQIDAVRRIAIGLSTATEMDELIRDALHTTLASAQSEAGSILLYHPGKKKLVFKYVVGEKADELTGMELEPDQGLAGKVFQAGEASVSEDVGKESAHLREVGEKVGYHTTNMVTVPLRSSEIPPLGVMQVLNKRGGPFDEYDVKLIETIAAQVTVAIKTIRLHEEARLATVMRFIGDISHDVKNMVTPAMTGAETLQIIADDCFRRFDEHLGGAGNAEAETGQVAGALAELRRTYPEIIAMVLEGCDAVQQRMAEIAAAVKGIVSEPHFEPTDVVAIARRVGTMLTPQARKKDVGLTIESVRELPPAMVDGKQIYNALYNLIFNAIDACDEGDTIVLRFDGRPDGKFPEGDYLLIECADTGPGMPEHVKARLFTDEAISTKPMGTGLGTRIVKNVIDAHSGTIEVESELGVGTTIRCRVPAGCGR